MTIIKQNNIACQHKIIFYIWDGFVCRFGVGTYISITSPIPVFWNRKNSNSYSNPRCDASNI